VLSIWGALSDERTGLLFAVAAGLASAVIFASESCGAHDHILLPQIRDSPNLEGQIPVFMSFRNRAAQLYPLALCSLLVISYDSQSYMEVFGLPQRLNRMVLFITSWHWPLGKHRSPHLLHSCVRVCWGDHVIATEPSSNNSRCFQSHPLATAVSAGFTILPRANIPQRYRENREGR
jgi:hypothetical protein